MDTSAHHSRNLLPVGRETAADRARNFSFVERDADVPFWGYQSLRPVEVPGEWGQPVYWEGGMSERILLDDRTARPTGYEREFFMVCQFTPNDQYHSAHQNTYFSMPD